jgi:hypothetical protein
MCSTMHFSLEEILHTIGGLNEAQAESFIYDFFYRVDINSYEKIDLEHIGIDEAGRVFVTYTGEHSVFNLGQQISLLILIAVTFNEEHTLSSRFKVYLDDLFYDEHKVLPRLNIHDTEKILQQLFNNVKQLRTFAAPSDKIREKLEKLKTAAAIRLGQDPYYNFCTLLEQKANLRTFAAPTTNKSDKIRKKLANFKRGDTLHEQLVNSITEDTLREQFSKLKPPGELRPAKPIPLLPREKLMLELKKPVKLRKSSENALHNTRLNLFPLQPEHKCELCETNWSEIVLLPCRHYLCRMCKLWDSQHLFTCQVCNQKIKHIVPQSENKPNSKKRQCESCLRQLWCKDMRVLAGCGHVVCPECLEKQIYVFSGNQYVHRKKLNKASHLEDAPTPYYTQNKTCPICSVPFQYDEVLQACGIKKK